MKGGRVGGGRRTAHRLALALLALVAALGAVLAAAGPAAAHAQLLSTDPVQGSSVAAASTAVTLRFGEDVTFPAQALRVLGPTGDRVDDGVVVHPDGDGAAAAVGLRPGLRRGSYSVLWAVVSADSHPVRGTFAFGIGVPAGTPPSDDAGAGSPTVSVLHAVGRAVAYVGTVLLLGGVGFLVGSWQAGGAVRRARQVVGLGWVLLVVSTTAVLVLDGPYASGLGLGSAGSWSLLHGTLATRFGKLLVVRLLLLLLAVPVLRRVARGAAVPLDQQGTRTDLVALGATVVLTFSLTGHAGTGVQVPLAVAADAVHLAAACAWLGGLAVLGVALLPGATAGELRVVLPRWHRVALACVVLLAVTGTYASWRQVGTLRALPATDYGRLVLAKLGGFALLLALGDQGRRWVRRHATVRVPRDVPTPAPAVAPGRVALLERPLVAPAPTDAPMPPVTRLRRSVLVEVGVGMAVLAVTAVLVATQPARETYAAPYAATLTAQGLDGTKLTVQLDVERTSRSPGALHVYTYTPAGAVAPISSVVGQLEQRAAGIPPLTVAFAATGIGHDTSNTALLLPTGGTWTLTLQLRTPTGSYAGVTSWSVR